MFFAENFTLKCCKFTCDVNEPCCEFPVKFTALSWESNYSETSTERSPLILCKGDRPSEVAAI